MSGFRLTFPSSRRTAWLCPVGATRSIHNRQSGGRATQAYVEGVIMSKNMRKTNQALVALIGDLKDQSRSTGSALWRDVAEIGRAHV